MRSSQCFSYPSSTARREPFLAPACRSTSNKGNDIFPEEFPHFRGFRSDLLETLIGYHGDLFEAVAWRQLQSALRAGNILDIFPYAPATGC